MTPDITLTDAEIHRTAFRRISKWSESPFGTLTGRDKNEMCIYCKNEFTDKVHDDAYLAPFKRYWGDASFAVMHCGCCGAVFSFGGKDDS